MSDADTPVGRDPDASLQHARRLDRTLARLATLLSPGEPATPLERELIDERLDSAGSVRED